MRGLLNKCRLVLPMQVQIRLIELGLSNYAGPRAGQAGYVLYPEVYVDEGFVFVAVGEEVHTGDEFFNTRAVEVNDPSWCLIEKPNQNFPTPKGRPSLLSPPIRRRSTSIASKWSCGHGRDSHDLNCRVCAAVYFRDVTT